MNDRIAHLHPELLGRLAHELRGSLAVILGALDEVERAPLPLGGAALPFLRMAERGARRSLRIADSLQQTAQLEGGTVEWAREPVDVSELLAVSVITCERLDPRKGVRVDVVREGTLPAVTGDSGWLQLAVAEVLGNAVRFARSLVTVNLAASEGAVRVTITDDGPGFDARPARRTDRPSGAGGRVGLSLLMVVEVLAAHGGALEIGWPPDEDSGEPREGARVTLLIPVHGAPHTSAVRAADGDTASCR